MQKLIALLSLGQGLYGRYLFQRLLSGVILLASLAVVAAALTSMMLIGGFYAAYLALLHYGVEQQNALLIVAAAAASITLAVILLTIHHIRRLHDLPRRLMQNKAPLAAEVSDVVEAFLNGLFSKRR